MTKTLTPELKPCPFCGKTAHLRVFPAHENQTAVPSFAVRCCFHGEGTGCGAETGYGAQSEAEAWDAWNIRSAPSAEPVARAHVTLEDDGLYAKLEVLDGTNLQPEISPIDLFLSPPDQSARIVELEREVERLNKWADSFSDAQLKERQTCEALLKERAGEIADLRARLAKAVEVMKPVQIQANRYMHMEDHECVGAPLLNLRAIAQFVKANSEDGQ